MSGSNEQAQLIAVQKAVLSDNAERLLSQEARIAELEAENQELVDNTNALLAAAELKYDTLLQQSTAGKQELTQLKKIQTGIQNKLSTVENQLDSALQNADNWRSKAADLETLLNETRQELAATKSELSKEKGGHLLQKRKVVALQTELTQTNERMSNKAASAELVAELRVTISRLQAESSALIAEAHERDELLRKMTSVVETSRPTLESLANHVEKSNKLLAEKHVQCEELRRKITFVTRVNELLQRQPIYAIAGTIDFYLLSTNRDWLGAEFKDTPYCTYLGLDYDGRGQVVFEHNGQLMVRSGDGLPLSAEQQAELLARIKELPVDEFVAGVREGERLAQKDSVVAHAHPDAVMDLRQIGNHLKETPLGDELVKHYQVVTHWVRKFKADVEAREARKKAAAKGRKKR